MAREELLKLTVDLPDELYERLCEVVSRSRGVSVQSFGSAAIERAIREADNNCPSLLKDQFAELLSQTQRLQNGQLAIAALIDSLAIQIASGPWRSQFTNPSLDAHV